MRKIGVLLLVALMMISLTACKSDDYKEAMELYVNREYDAALVIFTELGDYEDSINMVTRCRHAQAHSLLQNGKYEEARVIFEELGDYEDSAENVKECYYQQAIALMEGKQYEAAEEIFAMLGDYKDSADYANGMGWYLFTKYISERGEVTPDNLLYEHDGVIYMDSDCLCVEIGNSSFTAKTVIAPQKSVADLYATFNFKFGYYEIRDKATTKWDISRYEKGDFISWDEQDHYFSGRKFDGSYNSADTADTLYGESGANLITALTDCIRKGLDESGLDVTMADLGFAKYDDSPDIFY
jgi:tetratricopeptide (TPR) repeat protein